MQTHFENVVFAGGGNRCLWQVGFWEVASAELGLRPSRVAAASAGAAAASFVFGECVAAALDHFKRATAANRCNVYPTNLFKPHKHVFPQGDMYRALLCVIDAKALARLHAGPELIVTVTRAPRWLGPYPAVPVGLVALIIEGVASSSVESRLTQRLGFRVDSSTAQACETPSDLADLVLASSCTPPLTRLYRCKGKPALDAGFADNVPVAALGNAPGATLVLLTHCYRDMSDDPSRRYIQPSKPIPVSPWDFTNPTGLQKAYDLGRRDAELFVRDQRSR